MTDRLFLLDTNVVVALVRGQGLGQYIDSKFGLSASNRNHMVSVVSHGEVRVLASRNGWGKEKLAALENALSSLVTIDIGIVDVIDAYVEIDLLSQKHPKGARNMGKNDIWIAACAKASGATLLTTDKDFDHLNPETLAVKFVDPSSRL